VSHEKVEKIPALEAPFKATRSEAQAISDRHSAVSQAFGNTVPRGRYPSLFLFVECDPSWVDVNVRHLRGLPR